VPKETPASASAHRARSGYHPVTCPWSVRGEPGVFRPGRKACTIAFSRPSSRPPAPAGTATYARS